LPGYGQLPSASQPPAQDLHSQYQALRPILGDRDAMLATVHPEIGQTLIAQARAGQQRSGNAGDASMFAQGQFECFSKTLSFPGTEKRVYKK
jgi:hypothetical protein